MPSFLAGLGNGLGTIVGGGGNAGAASDNAWNYGQYSPFTVNNPMGTTSWNGTSATNSFSPTGQNINNALTGNILNNGGVDPNFLGGQYNSIFGGNNFNQGVTDQFNRSVGGIMPFLQQASQSNLDNEFSKGTLASTAGSYQTAGQQMGTGATLSNLYNQAFQDQLGRANSQFGAAQGVAGQGLGLLNSSLGGYNQQNQSLLQQMQLGGNLGAQRSGANVAAAVPGIETGSMQDNATAGLLSGLLFGGGSQGGLLQSLLGGSGGGGGLLGGLGSLGSMLGKGIGGLFGGGSGGGGSGGGIDSGLNVDGGLNDLLNQLGSNSSGAGSGGMTDVGVDPINLTDEGASSNWWD